MGYDYSPDFVYGFVVEKVFLDDGYLGFTYGDAKRHHSDVHVVGLTLNFEDYKKQKIPPHITRYGALLKKHLDIECDYYIVQTGDGMCEHCKQELPIISSLTFIRLSKPEWDMEKCLEVLKDISGEGELDLKYLVEDIDEITEDYNLTPPFY